MRKTTPTWVLWYQYPGANDWAVANVYLSDGAAQRALEKFKHMSPPTLTYAVRGPREKREHQKNLDESTQCAGKARNLDY